MEFKIITPEKVDSPEYLRAWDIYLESFAERDTKSLNIIMKLLKGNPAYKLFVDIIDKYIVGIGLASFYPVDKVAFIDYIGISKNFHGRGIELFIETELKKYSDKLGCKYLFIEIDRNAIKNGLNGYTKLQVITDIQYRIPPCRNNGTWKEGMLGILSDEKIESIPLDYVKKIVSRIYKEIYFNMDDMPLNKIFNNVIDRSVLKVSFFSP